MGALALKILVGGIRVQSAVCLHFQLFVYIFSCLFTFLNFQTKTLFFVKSFATVESSNPWFSAICLHFLSAVCLLFCLHCQLIVYFFNFQAKTLKNHDFFAKNLSLNSWFSAVCLPFCLHCRLFVYFLSADCWHCQLFVYFYKNLNFCTKT